MRLLRSIFDALWVTVGAVFSYSSELEYHRKCQERPLLDDDLPQKIATEDSAQADGRAD